MVENLAGIAYQRGAACLLAVAAALGAAAAYGAKSDAGTQCPHPIRLVLVDRATLSALGPLPWPRDRHAKLVRILCDAGAKAVALVFHFKDPASTAGDNALAREINRCGRVYVSTGKCDTEPDKAPEDAWFDRMVLPVNGRPPPAILTFQNIQLPFPKIAGVIAGIGATDRLVDKDMRITGLPLMIMHRERIIPSLALRIFLDLEGIRGPFFLTRRKYLKISGNRITLDKYGSILVNLTPPGSAYSHYSFVDVMRERVRPANFRDAIVIVGIADPKMDVNTAVGPKSSMELIADQLVTIYQYVSERRASR